MSVTRLLSLCILFPLSGFLLLYIFLLRILEYAQVTRMLGNGRLEALCFDGKTRLAHIRGKMRKRVWVNAVLLLPPIPLLKLVIS